MKHITLLLTLLTPLATFAADAPKPADATSPSSASASTNAPPRRNRLSNSNDVFYTLGPDSQPRPGVPKGKYTEAKVIQSEVFPGTQHTYWVYVPAQYDPAIPTAVMIFNDGQAMKN